MIVRSALWGAAGGAVVGLAAGLLLSVVVVGTDDIPDFADREQLPALYLLISGAALLTGAVLGTVVALVAVLTARTSAGDATARRRKGTLAAAGLSAALCVVTAPIGSALLVAAVAAAVVAAALTWVALPRLVDLDGAPPTRAAPAAPGQYGADPATPAAPTTRGGLSTPLRVVVTLAAAGIGGLLGTNVVMALVSPIVPSSRTGEEAIAFVVLLVVAVVVGSLVWRRTGPVRS